MSTVVVGRLLGATPPQQYFCHQCEHTVIIFPSPELFCPICHNDFLEEHIPPAPPQTPVSNIRLFFSAGGRLGGASIGNYFVGPGFEDLIQQLSENDQNSYGTPPASKTVVEGLPDIKITEGSLECPVCKDCFEINEIVKEIPCKHIYHKNCILPWLELHNSCPLCRFELPTDDPDYENRMNGSHNDSSGGDNSPQRNGSQNNGSVGDNSQQMNRNQNNSSGGDNSHQNNGNQNRGGDNSHQRDGNQNNSGGGDNLGNEDHVGSHRQMVRNLARRVTMALPHWFQLPRSSLGRSSIGGNRDGGGSSDSGQSNVGAGGGHA